MPTDILIKEKIEFDKIIKISEFRTNIRKTSPHKHNSYFEIIYLASGSGFHSIDSQIYEVKPPIAFFIRKEQIHHWELDSEPTGYVIIIKKEYIEQCVDIEIKNLLYRLSSASVLYLNETGTITALFKLIIQEILLITASSNIVLDGLIKALLGKLILEGTPFPILLGSGAGLYYSFKELLSQEVNLKNSVAYYAEQLNTSPQNLNASCRKEVSMTASNVLSEFIISEAKRLLMYTDCTVSEIAFRLNFNDSSHFIKYFKRSTNLTPQSFRNPKN